ALMLAGALAFLAAVRELFVLQVLSFVFIFSIYAQSWNLVAHSGQHSLGHATFLGLGSYGSILVATRLGVPPAVALFLGPLLPAGTSRGSPARSTATHSRATSRPGSSGSRTRSGRCSTRSPAASERPRGRSSAPSSCASSGSGRSDTSAASTA